MNARTRILLLAGCLAFAALQAPESLELLLSAIHGPYGSRGAAAAEVERVRLGTARPLAPKQFAEADAEPNDHDQFQERESFAIELASSRPAPHRRATLARIGPSLAASEGRGE